MNNLWDAFKQYLSDAAPGGALNPEVTPQGVLDTLAMSTMAVPVVGDVAGGVADAYRYAKNPEERTPGNFALSAMGLLPFVPGMTVYHGSPAKFSQFDQTKIGSGEGAQAYGYGHYVAESPGVADAYRSNLSKGTFLSPSGAVISQNKLVDMGFDKGEAQVILSVLRSKNGNFIEAADYLGAQQPRAAKFLRSIQGAKLNDGNFYEIDLPDEQIAKMLDWDQEIGKQSPEIQALAKQYGINKDDLGGDLVAAMDAKRPAGAEAMRKAGVPGIKYFDAQSRGGKRADTQNFVVFPGNENLLNIKTINNQPVDSLFKSIGR